MKIVNDQKGNPTYAPQLAQAIYVLTEAKKTGIYHCAGKSVIDRYTFALEVSEVFGLDKTLIKPVTTLELGQIVKRPLNGGLIVNKVESELPFKFYTSREGLEEMKRSGPV